MLRLTASLLLLISLIYCSDNPEYMPAGISGLSLTNRLTGKEAAEFLNKLHLQKVTDEQTEIGFYTSNAADAVVYLTYYSNAEEAGEYEARMTDKILNEKTPFIMGEYKNVEGKKIFRTFGMGQTHFVFSHRNVLIWLSLNTSLANDFLEEYLEICRSN